MDVFTAIGLLLIGITLLIQSFKQDKNTKLLNQLNKELLVHANLITNLANVLSDVVTRTTDIETIVNIVTKDLNTMKSIITRINNETVERSERLEKDVSDTCKLTAAQKQLNTHLVNALSKVIDRIKELDKPIVIKRRRK